MEERKQDGYTSAFDVGEAGAGGGGTDEAATTEAVEDVAAPAEATTPEVEPQGLEDSIVIALIELHGAATVPSIWEAVQDRTGERFAQGLLDKRLGDMLAAGKLERRGDTFALSDAKRAEYLTPAVVAHRRATILRTMFVMAFPEERSFDALWGVSASALREFMSDTESGALTGKGFITIDVAEDVLADDLKALAGGKILIERTAEEEDAFRDQTVPTAESSTRPAHFALAAGQVERMLSIGADAMVAPTVAGLVAAPAVDEAAKVAAGTEKQLDAIRAAVARADAAERESATAKSALMRVRTYAATMKLEFLVDDALGPPAPPPPGRRIFPFTQTVTVNDAERSVLLREVADLERQLHIQHGKIELGKKALKSTKSAAEEEIERLEDEKAQRLALTSATTRTYTVQAWSDFCPQGDPDSNGLPINLVRAEDDNRVLVRQVLTPRDALAAHAGDLPQPKSLEDAAPPAPSTVLAKMNSEELAAQIAAKGVTATVEQSDDKVVVTTGGAADPVGYVGVVESYLRAKKSARAEDIASATKLPLDAVVRTLTATAHADRFHQIDDGAWRPGPAPAPIDEATKAAAAANVAKKTEAEAKAQKAPKVEMTVDGLVQPLTAVLVAAGGAGIDEAELAGALCAATGLPAGSSITRLVNLAKKKLVNVDILGTTYHHQTAKVVTRLVAEAGETGLPVAGVCDAFAKSTGITVASGSAIEANVLAAVQVSLTEGNINRGSTPSGDLLWLAGEPDPRAAQAEPAATPKTQAKTAKTPKAAPAKTTAKSKK